MITVVKAIKAQGIMIHFQNTTKTSRLLLLYFLVASFNDLTLADPPYSLCSNTSNYAVNSSFQNNLNTLLSSLNSISSISKLYSNHSGDDPDRVYGLYMCYDYVADETCKTCIKAASGDIKQHCPDDKKAVVFEEVCQLRYSNGNFLGHLDVSGNIAQSNIMNISEPELFKSVVKETLGNLTKKAAFDPSVNMYATKEAAFTQTDTVYALVQCTTDLSPDDCNTCLQVAIENISSCCYFCRGARLLSRSCYLRYELYAFYRGETGESAAASNPGTGKDSPSKIWIIIILTIASALLAVALLGTCVYCLAIKSKSREDANGVSSQQIHLQSRGKPNSSDFQHQSFQGRDRHNAREFPFIDFSSIQAATGNFADSNLLGQGGFGPVYKGILRDGKEVAIKRLSTCSEQGTDEFTNEVLLIMKLQHKNLVRLLGFCVHRDEKLLVYEFMPNSSLDVILFDPRKRAQLNWIRRRNIINGIAKGILYLHEDSRLRIIHRDLKASNVLLDNEMNPKISDFGMARIFAGSEGEANTARIVGTYGYMAPEYAMEGLYSIKSDVFSFGVLMFETMTGRRNAGFHKSKRAPNLVACAWQLWTEGYEKELMDPLLSDSCSPDEFSRYIHIGLLCVQEDACDRPTMSSVALMLKSETETLRQPSRPAFSVGRFTDHLELDDNCCSVNGLTFSDILPR